MNILRRAGLRRLIQISCFAIPIMAGAANLPFDAAVEYIPEHSEILLGEPLYVTFSVTNKGSNTFYLETGGDYRRLFGWGVSLLTPWMPRVSWPKTLTLTLKIWGVSSIALK